MEDGNTSKSSIMNNLTSVSDKFSKNIPKQPIRALYEIPGALPRFS